jgi:hypothetical protein
MDSLLVCLMLFVYELCYSYCSHMMCFCCVSQSPFHCLLLIGSLAVGRHLKNLIIIYGSESHLPFLTSNSLSLRNVESQKARQQTPPIVVLGRSCALVWVGGTCGTNPRLPIVMTSLGYMTLELACATYARNDLLKPPVLRAYHVISQPTMNGVV